MLLTGAHRCADKRRNRARDILSTFQVGNAAEFGLSYIEDRVARLRASRNKGASAQLAIEQLMLA